MSSWEAVVGEREHGDLEDLWRSIENRMGVCPSFFRLAASEPPIARMLFALAEFAYLDNPIPSDFKEKLFTWLSRFCPARYCVTRHAAFLMGRGTIAGDPNAPSMPAEEVAAIVTEPLPEPGDIPDLLEELARHPAPVLEWPEYDSRLGWLVRIACSVLFLEPQKGVRAGAALRRLFGAQGYEHLVLFLAFVRMAHFWTEVHPELALEGDVNTLLAEHEALASALRGGGTDAARVLLGEQLRDELAELREARVLLDALRESEARYRDLYDRAPDMYCSVDPRTGLVVECNQTLLDKTGFAREDVVDHPILDRCTPDSRDAARAAFERFETSGTLHGTEIRLERKRGEPIDVSLQVTAARNAFGEVVSSRAVLRDITEQRRFEADLHFQKYALDESSIVAITDVRGTITYVNDKFCEISGYSRGELIGENHRLINSGLHDIEFFREMYRTIARGQVWRREIRNRRKDSSYYWVDTTIVPALGPDGRPERYVSIRTDITQRKRAEDALREADRRKDEFIAILAHELRNPLAPVRTAVQFLKEKGPAEPQLERARDVIDRQVSHMAHLIDDLLDVSRIARGMLTLQTEICDVAAIVRQTAEDYRADLEAAGLTLTVVDSTDAIWVSGDPVRLAQMVGNLLNNAGRFTERGGRVELRVERDVSEHVAVLSVVDTGVGLDRELLARLFDPFSQSDQGLARAKGGLGLGLALTKGLAELHGGNISAHSEGSGTGSTFTLRLPLADAPKDRERDPSPTTTHDRGLRILIVEDNQDAAEMLGALLELNGHQVEIALDGPAAIRATRTFAPEVVISDLGLPGDLDGYALGRALRSEPALHDTMLIALSGYANEEARRRSRESGYDAHFAKPPDLRALTQTLANAARR